MKFTINGEEFCLIVEAPEDITLKQLLAQCDKIVPPCGVLGICSLEKAQRSPSDPTDLIISYNSVRNVDDSVWPVDIEE